MFHEYLTFPVPHEVEVNALTTESSATSVWAFQLPNDQKFSRRCPLPGTSEIFPENRHFCWSTHALWNASIYITLSKNTCSSE
jgi:hypothetical protein